MRDFLLTAIIAGFVPVSIVRPWIGMLVFAWLGYMNPHRLTWGFAYSMPFAEMIGGATILGFLFTKEKDKLPGYPLVVVWILWILWMNFTTLFAFNPDDAFGEWSRDMKIQLTSILTVCLMQSRNKLHLLVWVVALSVGFFGIKGGIFVALTGGNYLVFGPPDSFFEGNNGLAVALMMVLPLFWYLRTHTENRWLRHGLLVCAILMMFSILASYSRGAVLGLAAVSVYLVYKSRHRWSLLPMLVVLGGVALAFLPERWFERVETIQTYEEDGSAMGRINAWHFAFNVAVDRPLVGGGYEAFSREMFKRYAPDPEDFHDAHSIYFEALGEHGFVGLALFLTLGWLAFRQGNRIRKLCKDRRDLLWAFDLASMVQVCLVAYATAGAFVGLAYFDLYYHLLGMLVVTQVLVNRSLEEAPVEVEKPVAGKPARPAAAWSARSNRLADRSR